MCLLLLSTDELEVVIVKPKVLRDKNTANNHKLFIKLIVISNDADKNYTHYINWLRWHVKCNGT